MGDNLPVAPMKQTRKAAIQDFKQRTPERGAFAVRCTTTGRVWVGTSPNLAAAKNGLWFMLRTGSSRERGLQEAWNVEGESAFEFEILERLDDDVPQMRIADLLKASKARWATELSAVPLV
jgi:hypothetical protein